MLVTIADIMLAIILEYRVCGLGISLLSSTFSNTLTTSVLEIQTFPS